MLGYLYSTGRSEPVTDVCAGPQEPTVMRDRGWSYVQELDTQVLMFQFT